MLQVIERSPSGQTEPDLRQGRGLLFGTLPRRLYGPWVLEALSLDIIWLETKPIKARIAPRLRKFAVVLPPPHIFHYVMLNL
jgi:hypothetical protein